MTGVQTCALPIYIQPLTDALDTLLALHGVTYEWRKPEEHANRTGPQRGFISQDVRKILPDWVTTGPDGHLWMQTSGFEALTVESMRQLKAENDDLRKTNQELLRRVDALEKHSR